MRKEVVHIRAGRAICQGCGHQCRISPDFRGKPEDVRCKACRVVKDRQDGG
jgi:hypothetical protein